MSGWRTSSEIEMMYFGTQGTSDNPPSTSGCPQLPTTLSHHSSHSDGNWHQHTASAHIAPHQVDQDLGDIFLKWNDLLTKILTLPENYHHAGHPPRRGCPPTSASQIPYLSELAMSIILSSTAFLVILLTQDNHTETPEKLLGGVTTSVSLIPVNVNLEPSFVRFLLIKKTIFELSVSIGLFTAAVGYYTWFHSHILAVILVTLDWSCGAKYMLSMLSL
ncbi:hypothetical protein EDC04DRAFT_2603616 [Pisolithus marmoratus]|nr:hypothetical protein EDC04DRAFT_2603616 [Pisolithus marmoratus]